MKDFEEYNLTNRENESIIEGDTVDDAANNCGATKSETSTPDLPSATEDKMFLSLLKYIVTAGECSSSMLMRKFGIGFQRAVYIVDAFLEMGYIKKAEKGYSVLLSEQELTRQYGDIEISE